jgi:multicomponent Na+:H+ antiporter subunit F
MNAWFLGLGALMLLALLASLVKVMRGSSAIDQMLAAQLVGTLGVGATLLLSAGLEAAELVDVALVLAALAAVSGVTFVRRTLRAEEHAPERGDHG